MSLIAVLKDYFWKFPDGLFWRYSEKPTLNSRKKKYGLFTRELTPRPNDKILDVGVAEYTFRATNYLEQWYPNKSNITAITNNDLSGFNVFRKQFPEIKLLKMDARKLDFPDNSFNIVFSNAVIEHVGEKEKQKQFVLELLRVGKKVFLTTPSKSFPIDTHTLIPIAHWLPIKIRNIIYEKLGKSHYASIDMLNLLSENDFRKLFPENVKVKIIKQYFFCFQSNLIAIAKKE